VVVAVLALDSLVLGMFAPLSLLYLVAVSGQSLVRVGVLLTVAGALALPVPLWTGRLVDTWGAKPLVLTAQVVQAAGFLGYLLGRDVGVLFVAAVVASVGSRIFWSSIFALVGEMTAADVRPRARERWFALIAALRAVGYGVGAVVAGVAVTLGAERVGRYVVLAAALLLVAAAVAVGLLPGRGLAATDGEDQDGPVASLGYRVLWRDRGYLGLAAVNVLYALCNVMLGIALAPTIARAVPGLLYLVGPLLVANTIVQATLQVVVARRVRRASRVRALALAGTLWAGWALLVVAALHAPRTAAVVVLVAGVLCYAFAQLVHGPLINALSVEAAPAALRGRYLAVFGYSTALAGVLAPALFAVLFTVANELPWLVLAVCGAAAAPLVIVLARRVPALRTAPTPV
jgi:MFS family permease